MTALTCITCLVEFADPDLFRLHYKTDWHRYNLKRKVAEMPPVTAQNFQERVLAQRAQASEEAKDTKTFCEACNKCFNSKNAYDNHLPSKRHKNAEIMQQRHWYKQKNFKNQEKGVEEKPESSPSQKEMSKSVAKTTPLEVKRENAVTVVDDNEEAGSDAESWESWEEEPLTVSHCLFCSKESRDLEANLEHMTSVHSLFLPDVEYLVDLEGFIEYLGGKVGVDHICLWCNGKGRSFYSTDAVQKHMKDKNHCRILFEGEAAQEYSDFYDYRKSYPDGGVENEEVSLPQLDGDGFELTLPSGATIGHRSLMRYYKQNLHVCQRSREMSHSVLPKLLAKYRALGWTGATGEVAVRRRQDLAYMQRLKFQHHMQLGVKANSLQRHFRHQNPK